MGHDLRLALASLRREKLLSLLVVAILAISLGVHTAVFALVHAAFHRPLPLADAERMVVVESVSEKTGGAYGLSIPDADDYRREAELLDEVGAFTARRDNLVEADGRVVSTPSALVTSGALRATGVEPILGRLFSHDDDRQGGDSFKVILGHGLWRSRFGADPEVLGRTLRTSLGTYEVIGVLPQGFAFPGTSQLWLPYQNYVDTQDSGDSREDQRSLRWSRGIARLALGTTIEQAGAELTGLAEFLAERHPEENAAWRPRLTPFREFETQGLASHLRSLFAMTWVFVVLAAVNLAGLQLARAVARSQTFSLQLALGARKVRLGRQLLLEGLLLTVPGVGSGLLAAHQLLRWLPALVPSSLPGWLDVRLGAEEIVFAAVAAIVVAVVAGLAPILVGWRADLRSLLAGRSAAAASGGRLRRVLVVAEVAVAAVLLVAAGLLARSFRTLETVDPGFAAESLVSIEMSPQVSGSYVEQVEGLSSLYRRLRDRLLEVPGVLAVGGTTHLPYLDIDRRPVKMQARGGEGDEELEHQTQLVTVDASPGYFEAMGIPIEEGRDFTWDDTSDKGMVIVLSRRAADQLFPGRSPLGQEARITSDSWARVIGVVGDVRYDPREAEHGAELYYPITQYKAWRQRLVVRLEGSPESSIPALREAVERWAPETGLVEIRRVDAVFGQTLWQERLLGRLAPAFALIALLLASLGVYGLLAHDLARRRQEMGVRAALGAPRWSLSRLVLVSGLRLMLVGAAAGGAIALVAAPLLAASLFGVPARDPGSFAVAVLALLATGFLASLAPAWRAARLDPMESLRE